MATVLLSTEYRRRMAVLLCPLSMPRYAAAARSAAMVVAVVWPAPLPLQAASSSGTPALFYHLTWGCLHLLGSLLLTLRHMLRTELPQRLAYVRRRRLAAEAAGLHARRRQWDRAVAHGLVLGSAAWALLIALFFGGRVAHPPGHAAVLDHATHLS